MPRLLLVALLAAAAFPAVASADPLVCVRTVNSKGVHFDVCPPVDDVGNTESCVYVPSPSVVVPDVYVCSTYL